MILNQRKEIALSLLDTFKDAGNVALELRKKGLKKEIKSDNTPVTNGDIEVNNILTKKISTLTPEIPIISEETSSNKKNENLKLPFSKRCFSLNYTGKVQYIRLT